MTEEETSERIPYAERRPDRSMECLGGIILVAVGVCIGVLGAMLFLR